jgi:hypothetical protein
VRGACRQPCSRVDAVRWARNRGAGQTRTTANPRCTRRAPARRVAERRHPLTQLEVALRAEHTDLRRRAAGSARQPPGGDEGVRRPRRGQGRFCPSAAPALDAAPAARREKRAITPIGRDVGVWVSSSREVLRHAACPDKPEPPGNHRLIRYVGGSDRHGARYGVGPARQRALSRPCPPVVAGPRSMASCRPCSDHDSKTFTMWRSPLGVNVLRAPARPSNKASSMRQSIACFSPTRRATIHSRRPLQRGPQICVEEARAGPCAPNPAGVEESATIASFS